MPKKLIETKYEDAVETLGNPVLAARIKKADRQAVMLKSGNEPQLVIKAAQQIKCPSCGCMCEAGEQDCPECGKLLGSDDFIAEYNEEKFEAIDDFNESALPLKAIGDEDSEETHTRVSSPAGETTIFSKSDVELFEQSANALELINKAIAAPGGDKSEMLAQAAQLVSSIRDFANMIAGQPAQPGGMMNQQDQGMGMQEDPNAMGDTGELDEFGNPVDDTRNMGDEMVDENTPELGNEEDSTEEELAMEGEQPEEEVTGEEDTDLPELPPGLEDDADAESMTEDVAIDEEAPEEDASADEPVDEEVATEEKPKGKLPPQFSKKKKKKGAVPPQFLKKKKPAFFGKSEDLEEKHLPGKHDQMSHAGQKGSSGKNVALAESVNGFEVKGHEDKMTVRNPYPNAMKPGTPEHDAHVAKLIKDHNEATYSGGPNKGKPYRTGYFSGTMFSFNTPLEAHAWISEYLGQLSDGKYENSNMPWEDAGDMKLKVDPTKPTQIIGPTPFRRGITLKKEKFLFDADTEYDKPSDIRSILSNYNNKQIDAVLGGVESAISRSIKADRNWQPTKSTVEDSDFISEFADGVRETLKSATSRAQAFGLLQKSLNEFSEQIKKAVVEEIPASQEDMGAIIDEKVQQALTQQAVGYEKQTRELKSLVDQLTAAMTSREVKSITTSRKDRLVRKSLGAIAPVKPDTVATNVAPVLAGDQTVVKKFTASEISQMSAQAGSNPWQY